MAPAMSTNPAMKVSHNATADLMGRLSIFAVSLPPKYRAAFKARLLDEVCGVVVCYSGVPASAILCRKQCLQILKRLYSGQALLCVSSRDVKQDTLHADRCRSEIVDAVHVARIKALLCFNAHALQGRFEDCGMGLFLPDNAGVGNTLKAVRDSAVREDVGDLAVCIRDHTQTVLPTEPPQRLARAWTDVAPIGGCLSSRHQIGARALIRHSQLV